MEHTFSELDDLEYTDQGVGQVWRGDVEKDFWKSVGRFPRFLWKLDLGAQFFVCLSLLQAQNFTVTGVVKDANTNEPLPGVTVVVKGTQRGVSADFDGLFSIDELKDTDILIFAWQLVLVYCHYIAFLCKPFNNTKQNIGLQGLSQGP